MKKMILSLSIIVFSFFGYSQTVNDVPIKDIPPGFMRIVGTEKILSTKVNINIDFGQETKFFSTGNDTRVKDENGKLMVFNSMVDALNFFGNYGYEFEQAYAITVGSQNVYHYLMRKR